MKPVLSSGVIVWGLMVAAGVAAAGPAALPQRPFPQHVSYAPGTILPNHRTRAQLDDDVRVFYSAWKAAYVVAAGETQQGNPLYRISFGSSAPERTVSEGQGYGMVIMALMAGYDADARMIFDGLWEFSRLYPSSNDPRLMAWEVPPGDVGSAFDGDADIAYGLLLAHAQWGSTGRIDYATGATTVIDGILASTIGPSSFLPMLGDWVSPQERQYNEFTPRSSDFILAHFRSFGRFTGQDAWSDVVSSCQMVIGSLLDGYSPATGLLPDFIVHRRGQFRPAPPNFLEGPNDGQYYYNAARDPWRLGTDALLNDDPASLNQAQKISAWIQSAAANTPANIRAGYKLNGVALRGSKYFTTIFAAPFGVAAMTNPGQQQWLNAVYDSVYSVHEDYYDDTVTLLCLLVMTGNYWDAAP